MPPQLTPEQQFEQEMELLRKLVKDGVIPENDWRLSERYLRVAIEIQNLKAKMAIMEPILPIRFTSQTYAPNIQRLPEMPEVLEFKPLKPSDLDAQYTTTRDNWSSDLIYGRPKLIDYSDLQPMPPEKFDEYYKPMMTWQREMIGQFSDGRRVSIEAQRNAGKVDMDKIYAAKALLAERLRALQAAQVPDSEAQLRASPDWKGSAALTVWHKFNGVILCECGDDTCIRQLTITQEQYVEASGPGWWRLTHPECAAGIDGCSVVEVYPYCVAWSR